VTFYFATKIYVTPHSATKKYVDVERCLNVVQGLQAHYTKYIAICLMSTITY